MRGIPSKVSTVIPLSCKEGFNHICRESEMKARFGELRRKVVDIYHTWHATPRVVTINASSSNGIQDSIIVSQQALEAWLSAHCLTAALLPSETDMPTNDDGPTHKSRSVEITISDILCEHNYLDPTKAQKMKRINIVCISIVDCAICH